MALVGAAPLRAQVGVTLGADALHDTNIFRTSRALGDRLGIRRSDTLVTAHGDVQATLRPGATTISLDGRAGQDWYARNGNLDNFNYVVSLGATKPDQGAVGYDLHADVQQQLTPFGDLGVPVRNLQSVQHIFGQGTLAITPSLRVIATPDFVRSTNGNADLRGNDYDQYGAGLGIGYFSPLGNSIGVTVSKAWTKGLHDRAVDGDPSPTDAAISLEDTSVDLRLDYAPSVISMIAARLSYVHRRNRSAFGSGYSGPAGSVTVTYRPSGSLELVGSAGRRLESQSYVYVESIRNDYASIALRLLVGGGTRLNLTGDYGHRRFARDASMPAGLMSLNDSTYRIGGSVEQRLFQRISLRITGQHERRDAADSLFSYEASSIMGGIAVSFGAPRS